MIAQNIIFFLFGGISIVASLGVVRSRDVVHAALFLVTVFASVAGLFLLIGAEFLAWVQVFIYIGAVTVLLLFGIMLTRAPSDEKGGLDNSNKIPAYIASLGLCAILITLLINTFSSSDKIIIGGQQALDTLHNGRMNALSRSLMYTYVFPFEVVGILLLAALIGAVVMARKD